MSSTAARFATCSRGRAGGFAGCASQAPRAPSAGNGRAANGAAVAPARPPGRRLALAAATAGLLLTVACGADAQQPPRKGDLITGQASVVDGASFDIKSNRIRLWGVDAPMRDARCFRNSRRWKPADDAAAALRRCI